MLEALHLWRNIGARSRGKLSFTYSECVFEAFGIQRVKRKRCFMLSVACLAVGVVWNVMAHARKPYFVLWRNGRVHLNRPAVASVQSATGSRGVHISVSNAGYTMFRVSVKGTGYPLHSPVSPFTSPPVRHRVPSHFSWSLLLFHTI